MLIPLICLIKKLLGGTRKIVHRISTRDAGSIAQKYGSQPWEADSRACGLGISEAKQGRGQEQSRVRRIIEVVQGKCLDNLSRISLHAVFCEINLEMLNH